MNVDNTTNLDGLSQDQLALLLQQAEHRITNYLHTIRNYSPEKMEKYGVPYLNRLKETRDRIAEKINPK